MKTRQSRRQTAKVSHSRWLAYATASAATALAGTNSAEAAIHYSGRVDEKFPPHVDKTQTFQLDQPGDSFVLYHFATGIGGAAEFNDFGIASAGFSGYSRFDSIFASKLYRGQRISPGLGTAHSYRGKMATNCFGQWRDRGIGFIGFAFNSGAGIQFGWARVRMGPCPNSGFELIDYAYADPGEAIGAGQGIPRAGEDGQDMSDEQGPDEGSLGGLAVGAVGLLAWRKSRSRIARLKNA